MNDIVPFDKFKAPAAMRERMQRGAGLARNFSEGVRAAFPILSIRGSKFIIRKDGRELVLQDNQGVAVGVLDVVMLNASPHVSKAYYIEGYDQGDQRPPDCWSLDGVKPDATVVNKVNPVCGTCPKNAFNSAEPREGQTGQRRGKACSDNRRVALIMPHELQEENPTIFMLKVPGTSLRPLQDYATQLERGGWEPAAAVTRLKFDPNVTYPKLKFTFIDALDDAEYDAMVKHAESKYVHDMLGSPDFEMGPNPSDAEDSNPTLQPRARQDPPVMKEEHDEGVQAPPPGRPKRARTMGEAAVDLAEEAVVNRQGKAKVEAAPPSGLIELPDGQWFDPSTGEYVEKPKPEVDMPEADPNTIELPDGKWYNKASKQFVTGPEVGAKPVAEAPPAKRRRRTKAEMEAAKGEAPEEQAAADPQESEPGDNGQTQTNGARPASSDLEGVLKGLVPPKK